MTVIYKLYSVILLTVLHIFHFFISNRFVRPCLIPLLFTTNNVKLAKSINSRIHQIKSEYIIPIDKIEKLNTPNQRPQRHRYEETILNIFLDTIISISMQLISLFLLDILQITDFQIRHYDWYFTLTILIYGLIYIIPTLILYFWIFKAESLNNINEWIELRKIGIIFIIWLSIIYCTTKFTILKEIDGNLTQLSLYLISLFGICCLSILNGIGCFMGCFEFYNWISGKEYKDCVLKEFEANDVIRSMDFTLNEDFTIFSKKLILLESLLRDISLLNLYNHGFHFWIRCSSWLYCFYKVIYGTVRIIQLFIDFIMMREKGVRENIYHGNGDFISITLAKIIIAIFYDIRGDNELLEQISMTINFVTSICFFFFSINNVLFTIKNLKALNNKGYFLNSNKVNFDKLIGLYSLEIYNLIIVEIGAVYVVSTALLLNTTNMPFHCSKLMINSDKIEILRKNVGNFINIDFINDWFDEWFSIGCLLSLIILTIIEKNRINKFKSIV